MNRRKKATRSRLPIIVFLLVCAFVAALLLKNKTGEGQPQASSTRTNNPSTNIAAAIPNQPAINDEDRVVTLIADGNQLLAKGDYAGAAQNFAQAVNLSPDQEDLHYNLAIALAKQGKIEEAKKHYGEALRIFPDYAEAHNNLGNLLMNENKLDEAVARFKEAIKNAPDNAAFHNNLGTAYARQNKVPEATVQFEEAVKHGPTFVEARVNLANVLLYVGRVDDAITNLTEAIRLKPTFGPAIQTMQRARQRQNSAPPPQ